ncbi:hypothetical protein PPERSA_04074 [Pseudocohnilembus persalinus]|uniref:Tubulin-tyrosine ligase/Tubulin polyglutamylase n=1 Tax=Pseudocohnilembus persalinus TaxID=266149 RepID=A0A0V0QL59_PSEPJ|nr:hypothetical protein PPERSA_04074 [Pseudocohnilembus persalinus]|eukprot:KRX02871.1 hypothetical protein PPERSA_04074 [Pseudocohnilembus persalinus]
MVEYFSQKNLQEQLNKLIKFAAIPGKYKFRDKISFLQLFTVKSLNYDIKKRFSDLREIKFQKKLLKEKLKQQKQKNMNQDSDSSESEDENSQDDMKIQESAGITDIQQWKKKNNVDPKTKVYIVKGGYHNLREGFERRGWVKNQDPFSPCFDYKWTTKIIDIQFDCLSENQIVNHFDQSQCITSKFGLPKSLRSLIYNDDVDIDNFFPRCYDLGDTQGFQDFIENYKFTKVESFLRQVFKVYNKVYLQEDQVLTLDMKLKIELACAICNRRNMPFFETYNLAINDIYPVVSPQEYDFLFQDLDFSKQQQKQQQQQKSYKPKVSNKKNGKIKQNKLDQKNIENMETKINSELQQLEQNQQQLDNNSIKNEFQQDQENHEVYNKEQKIELFNQIEKTLQEVKKKDPQYEMSGDKNIWIIKPNYLSRARGIKLFTSIDKILDLTVGKSKIQYVAQKYIENPLIIKRKKFDIRQWVIVQDFNPPKIWFWEECYARFCSKDYNENELFNKNSHLTNNSVNKKGKNEDIEENMWDQQQLAEHLKSISQDQSDVFYEKIQPKLKQIIIYSIKSCQDQIAGRKNSMELFGYDFMIDESFNPWLIEVNSSPTMEHSTSITSKLVTRLLDDVLKVTVDYQFAKKQKQKSIDTGGFKLIYNGND